MTDERRWTIRVCFDGDLCHDPDCAANACDLSSLVEVVPVSSVVQTTIRDEYLNAVEAVAGMLSMASSPEVLERCVDDLLTITTNARRLALG